MKVIVRSKSGPYYRRMLNLFGSAIIAYWPLWESSGTTANDQSGNGYNGTHSGVTLGSPGIGDGRTCPLWDAINDQVNVYSAGFRDAFNPAEGSVLFWAKVFNADVWSDATIRLFFTFEVDGNNYVYAFKSTTSGRVDTYYEAGDVSKFVAKTGLSTTGWMRWALIWSKSGDYYKAYLDGIQQGSTQTGLGNWVGTLSSDMCNIGSIAGGSGWHGYIAHFIVLNRPATPAEIAIAARV